MLTFLLRRLFAVIAAAALSAACAAPALAQGGGVFVDPNSPTAKEYAVPIESARANAGGATNDSGKTAAGAQTAQPFGEGVGDSSTNGGSASKRSGSSRTHSGSSSSHVPLRPIPQKELLSAARPVDGGGLGSSAAVVGIGGLVLLLGVGLGLVLRRRLRSDR